MHLLYAIGLLFLAVWCGFGLAASFEPGVGVEWRWLYGAALVVIGLATLAVFRPRAASGAETSVT